MKTLSDSSTRNAYLYIIKLLTKRDYSEYKLRIKLVSKGYEEGHINEAILEVTQKGYLKDFEYATARAKILMNKGIHPRLIEERLRAEQLSVTEESINDIFEEHGHSTSVQLHNLLTKKIRTLGQVQLKKNRDATIQKLMRYTLSKGHDQEDILDILNELIGEVI